MSGTGSGRPGPKAGAWTTAILVGHPFPKDASEMSLVHRDQRIETLPTCRADQSFAQCERAQRTGARRLREFDQYGLSQRDEDVVNGIAFGRRFHASPSMLDTCSRQARKSIAALRASSRVSAVPRPCSASARAKASTALAHRKVALRM